MTYWDELFDLIEEAGLIVTFDRFRDVTKGCGQHCKVYGGEVWCPNHQAAIDRGEYKPKMETP